MNQPLITVIIPVYNASSYIMETLESVWGQTYKNWELRIVDDGSSDSSVEQVRHFVARHPCRAELLFHEGKKNRGTSASRNLGLQCANGELICFLDADDVWNPDFLSFFSRIFSQYPEISMAYGSCWHWHAAGPDTSVRTKDFVQNLGIKGSKIVDSDMLFKRFLADEGAVPSPSGVMMRRSVLSAVGGWEETFRGMYDDQVLYSKLFLCNIAVYVTDQPMFRYRRHDKSLCMIALNENRCYESRKMYLAWLRQYVGQREHHFEDVGKVVDEQSWLLEIHRELGLLLRLSHVSEWIVRVKNIGACWRHLVSVNNDARYMLKLARYVVGQIVLQLFRRAK